MALIMVAGPVVAHDASDDDTHRGVVGRHAFVDSEARPGARCLYRVADRKRGPKSDLTLVAPEFVGVSVRPPRIAAIDRSERADHQPVAWRFILQERVGEGAWKNVKRSSLQVRRGSDDRAARFRRMAVRHDGAPGSAYRVKTKAYWLRHGRALRKVGAASHVVDAYVVRGDVMRASCPGGIPPRERL